MLTPSTVSKHTCLRITGAANNDGGITQSYRGFTIGAEHPCHGILVKIGVVIEPEVKVVVFIDRVLKCPAHATTPE